MTQSKKPNDIIINIGDEFTIGGETIDLSGLVTTEYFNGTSITDSITVTESDMITIDLNSNLGQYELIFDDLATIDPLEVEKMCKEYPALEKVWRNFKTVYDMVQQDYKGKKDSGEVDDDIIF